MSEVSTEHKGFKVVYSESWDSWTGKMDEKEFTAKTLIDLKKKINAHLKAESKFKDMVAFIKGGGWGRTAGQYYIVTITSVSDDGDRWIRNEKGSREKITNYTDMYLVNDKNKITVDDIEKKHQQIKIIASEIKEMESSLEILNTTE